MKNIISVIKSISRKPVKSILTLLTVAIGVGVLISALSISFFFQEATTDQLQKQGIIVTIANAGVNSNGELESVRPPEFDEDVLTVLPVELAGIYGISPVARPFWNDLIAGEEKYTIRTVYGVNEQYAKIMGLEITSGSFFTHTDIESGAQKAIISESLAGILFGSAKDAIGHTVKPPANTELRGPMRRMSESGIVMPTYTITGVYSDVNELKRKSYGIADMVVPYTAIIPGTMGNINMMKRFLVSTIVINVKGVHYDSIESQIRNILSRVYGPDVSVHVWEGNPEGKSDIITDARKTVNTFSFVVNLFGFILLLTGSIGILSIMLVEVLGRSREIALERAIGASKGRIIIEFFMRSIILSIGSALTGIFISILFSGPLKYLLVPIFSGISITAHGNMIINPLAIIIGFLAAVVIGGIFGTFPIFSVLKTNIAEGLREA